MDNNQSISVFPAADGYIAQFNVTEQSGAKKSKSSDGFEMIVILDRSGSMGQNVSRLLRTVIPDALNNLGLSDETLIHLITFDSRVEYFHKPISFFKTCDIHAQGCTQMTQAIVQLGKLLESIPQNKNIRILTISDGGLNDQTETAKTSSRVFKQFSGKLNCSSQAIRYNTSSYGQPDTKGLSSVLQFNTSGESHLLDIDYTNALASTASKIVEMFENDGLDTVVKLECSSNIFLNVPWGNPTNKINLLKGENTFWLTQIPENLTLDGHSVKVYVGDRLDISSFGTILKTKVNHFMKQLKLLKVVGTAQSNDEVFKILDYFQKLEKSFNTMDVDIREILKDRGLGARVQFFKELVKRKNRSIVARMSEIANDDKVGQLNSAQQATYLRTADVTTNSKSLAKRAIKSGLDFDSVTRQEVRNMKSHLDELKDVDDENHYKSFYNLDSTLGGIYTVCELDDNEGTLDELSASDILQMINIVGIPCESIVGDFPDPMCYRVHKLQLGSFVSVSDMMMVLETGNKLTSPYGDKKEITNVIPFFDDDRIHRFLMKYAPSILEYTCSIGMRRMIMDVPKTYVYTLLAGVWTIVEDINLDKSNINLDVFTKLVHTFDVGVGNMFNHVSNFIVDQDPHLSYYIGNNGITNMISPLIDLVKNNKTDNIHRILSALYSFEVYQATRKIFKGDDAHTKKLELLNDLLGINFDTYSTPLSEDFEDNIEPNSKIHHTSYYVNNEIFDNLLKRMGYIKFATLLPDLLTGAVNRDMDMMKEITQISDETIKKSLKLDFDVREFMFYCTVQSLIYDSKVARVDDDNKKMKILDCTSKVHIDNMVTEYVERQYRNKYSADLAIKGKREHQKLSEILVEKMITADQMKDFVDLFKNGLTKNTTVEVISDTYKLGYTELRDRLFDNNENVPHRKEKLWILVLGTGPQGQPIWNNGNVLRMNMKELESKFEGVDSTELWIKIKDIYIQRNLHIYRASPDGNDMPNRHSHCNGKPSYWAYGYKTLEDYITNITTAEWDEYKETHKDCCGVIRWINNQNKSTSYLDAVSSQSKSTSYLDAVNGQSKSTSYSSAIKFKKLKKNSSKNAQSSR